MMYEVTGYGAAPGYFRIVPQPAQTGGLELGAIYVRDSAGLQSDSQTEYYVSFSVVHGEKAVTRKHLQ